MRKLIIALAASGILAGSTPSIAAPCRDAKGKFTACPKGAPAAAAAPAVNKDAKGRCHVASGPKKGQLTKCPK